MTNGAIHPKRGQFFHSIVLLAMTGSELKWVCGWQPYDQAGCILLFLTLGVGAGYISHLILDECTLRSLPLHGKMQGGAGNGR